jgi:hypothetical protein
MKKKLINCKKKQGASSYNTILAILRNNKKCNKNIRHHNYLVKCGTNPLAQVYPNLLNPSLL